MNKKIEPSDVRVGSFLLDTLTIGMYDNPFHCMREYVQNAADAVADAVVAGVLKVEQAQIVITITGSGQSTSLTVRDNGVGVASASINDRLISVGNSNKSPLKHGGFRGIGRLAGIAYCTLLRFTTKAHGEEFATVVEFDCSEAKGFMAPGSDPVSLQEVMVRCVSVSTESAKSSEHFTSVELRQLTGQGIDFADTDRLAKYLSQYAPVDYAPEFKFAEVVQAKGAEYGFAIPCVPLQLKKGRETKIIQKPFRSAISAANKITPILGIQTIGSMEHGWFGWFTETDHPGEISDESVAGIRFRQKNIQVGSSLLLERIASMTESPSNRRFMRWVSGEIFVLANLVVPNARRDGFEDTEAWRLIEEDLGNVIVTISKLVRRSSGRRSKVDSIRKRIENSQREIEQKTDIAGRDKNRIDEELEAQLKKIELAAKKGADPKELSKLISQVKELRDNLRELPLAKPTIPPSMEKAFAVVKEVAYKEAPDDIAKRICDQVKKGFAKLE